METSEFFTEEIDYNELEIIQIVGKGAFGEVSKARLRDKVVAVKLISSESERKAFLTELKQLSRVSHPNIVQLYGASTKPPVCLVMEYAEGGSLYNVLHGTNGEQADYTAAHAMSWLLQCARGVEYLHNMKPKALIHRDLKPPNLLLILGGTVLKICDFGTACDVQTHMTNNKGSAAWMAPEVFEGSNYSEKCDVFSWGIIMWEVFTRRKPFDEIGGPAFRIMWAVHNGTRPPLIKNLPKALELLMTRCWSANSVERPPMSEVVRIMSHMSEFFKGGDEPLKYLNGSGHSDLPLSNQASWSQASAIQTPGATIRDTVLNVLGEPVPVLPSILTQKIYAPPVVLEDDSRPRGGMSAPPSLAASKEDLNGRSPRSGTPVTPLKRHSTDLSILDEFDVMSQQNNPGQEKTTSVKKGHRRSGSYGTPGMYTPVNQYLAPPTPVRPGKTHVRTGSGDYQPMSFSPGSSTPNTASPVPLRRKSPISAPIKMMPHVYSYPGSLYEGSAGNMNYMMGNGYSNVSATGMPLGADLSGLSADMNAMKVVSLSLDHQLQPLAAAPNNKESMEIFTQHCKLAEEYLKVQTEIALLMQRKHELMKDLSTRDGKQDGVDNDQIGQDFFQVSSENDSLTILHANLKKQVDQIRRRQQLPRIAS